MSDEKNEEAQSATIATGIIEKFKTKPGRVNGKNSRHKTVHKIPPRCRNEIELILQANRDKGASKAKKVGNKTQEKRMTVVRGFFSDLFTLGFKIESVYNLREKHLRAVFEKLEAEGQSPSTIQNKISIMRTFCEWIGKNGMVRGSTNYRYYVAVAILQVNHIVKECCLSLTKLKNASISISHDCCAGVYV